MSAHVASRWATCPVCGYRASVTEVCVCDSAGTIVRRIPTVAPVAGSEQLVAVARDAAPPPFLCASGCAPTAEQLKELADLAVR